VSYLIKNVSQRQSVRHAVGSAAKGDGAVDNPQAASPRPSNHGVRSKQGWIQKSAASTKSQSLWVAVITV